MAENVAFGLHGMSKGEQRGRTQDALDLVRLNGYESRYPHELSGGQQQRVALARTLAPSPIAVLLDEPFSNLDAGMRLEVRQEVEAILRRKGVATIFVTHDREEAFAFADRVGVMSGGRLEQIDAPYALYQAPVSPEVARIVGDCDFLQGVVRGNVAETELGSLPYTCGEGKLADGTVLTLVVRPQDLKPESDDAGICRVEALEYRGGDTMLAVRTPSGTALRCRLPRYSGFSKGEQITLTPVDSTPFIAFIEVVINRVQQSAGCWTPLTK